MSITRKQKRAEQKHFAVLADCLGDFYNFLSQEVQPSDEEVRAKFKQIRHSWRQYCAKKQLRPSAYDQFTLQVDLLWKHKLAKSQGENMN